MSLDYEALIAAPVTSQHCYESYDEYGNLKRFLELDLVLSTFLHLMACQARIA